VALPRWASPRLLLAAGLVCWGLLEAILIDGGWSTPGRCLFAVVVLGSVAMIDRWPWPVLAVQLAAIAAQAQLQVFDLDEAVTPLQAVPIVGWIAGSTIRDGVRSALLALALVGAIIALGAGIDLPLVGITLGVALGWGGARVAGTVSERRTRLERRLAAAGEDPERLIRHEVDDERARLARELDVVVLGAARQIDAEAARADTAIATGSGGAAALERIATSAGEAMSKIREALAILRLEEEPEPPADADALASAIASLRSRGSRVEIRDAGTASRENTLALTRVLQLAAAAPAPPRRLKIKAGGTETSVTLRYQAAAPASNRESFVRMRERALLYGGAVRMRRGGRALRVELPAPGREPAGRYRRGAVLAAAVVATLTALDLWSDAMAPPPVGAVAAVALAGLLTAWAWTRRPLALAAFAWLPIASNLLLGFEDLEATTIPLLAVAAFLPPLWVDDLAMRLRIGASVAAASLALLGASWVANGVILTDVPIVIFLVAAGWWVGVAVRAAATEADRLAWIGWATTRAEMVAARSAVEDERRRISRDLHDLVAHGLAIVSVQAWGAHSALASAPAQAREGIATIREATAMIVDELERLVRPGSALDSEAATIDDLVAQAREAGLPVSLDGALPADAPPAAAAILGQVVREALTNVIRHAGLVPTTVALRALPDGFEAEVRNGPGATGAASGGLGLEGMRGRLAEAGGTLDAGPLEEGGYRVRARLP
jgi:signal transduction histidine kinase